MKLFLTFAGCMFLVLAVQFAGCQQKPSVDISGIDMIAKDILTAIGDGQADKIYDTYFTPEYRSKLPRDEWKKMVDAYRQRLGDFKSLKRNMTSTTRIDGDAEGSFGFVVIWEKSAGSLVLNMSLREKWLLANIHINSPAFDGESMKEAPAPKELTEAKK